MDEEWEVVRDVSDNDCNLSLRDYPVGSRLSGTLDDDKIYLCVIDRKRTGNIYIPVEYCRKVPKLRRGGE